LRKMAEMAEHTEQTGSFESGIRNNYVKRYNAIVEHLEEMDVVPEELFPRLDDEADSGQLGAEAMLLADYLADFLEETPPPNAGRGNKPDMGLMVALAPFLESKELSNLVRASLAGTPPPAGEAPEENAADAGPDLQALVGLAPHIDSGTLAELVQAHLARHKLSDPRLLTALAPHMKSSDLSRILRSYVPEWFGGPAAPSPDAPPEPPAAARSEWVRWPVPERPEAPAPPPPPPASPPEPAEPPESHDAL
jgi:hypothetical protein